MSIHRHATRRDDNERGIIEALRAAGALVVQLNQPLDLLVGYDGAWTLLEVKMPGGRLTTGQEKFLADVAAAGLGAVTAVVRTATDALQLIGAKDLNVEIGPKRPANAFPAWPTMPAPEGAD